MPHDAADRVHARENFAVPGQGLDGDADDGRSSELTKRSAGRSSDDGRPGIQSGHQRWASSSGPAVGRAERTSRCCFSVHLARRVSET
jgi:hypothetical protein